METGLASVPEGGLGEADEVGEDGVPLALPRRCFGIEDFAQGGLDDVLRVDPRPFDALQDVEARLVVRVRPVGPGVARVRFERWSADRGRRKEGDGDGSDVTGLPSQQVRGMSEHGGLP